MKNEIIKFSITDLAIQELATKYQDMKIINAKSYKLVTAGIGEIRSIRVSVEKRRKELKADALSWGRNVDAEAKRITELLLPIENDLKTTKQTEDTRKDAIKAEKEQAEKERIESIQAKIAAFPPDMSRLPQLLKMTAPEIQEMQDALAAVEIDLEIYQEFMPEAIKTKEEKKKLLQEYYIARITMDAETAKQKAEAERQEQAKVEQAAKQKIENDRLNKIREEQEAETQKLRDAQAKIDAQKKALQDEKNRLEKEQIERARIEQEKIEAEKQEKARIKKETEEKVAREKAAAEEKARQEALQPDRKKIRIYMKATATAMNAIDRPAMKTKDGKAILLYITDMLEKTITYATEQVEM